MCPIMKGKYGILLNYVEECGGSVVEVWELRSKGPWF